MKKKYLLIFAIFPLALFSANYTKFNSADYIYSAKGICSENSVRVGSSPNEALFLYEQQNNNTKIKKKKYSSASSYLLAHTKTNTSIKLVGLDSSANINFFKIFSDSISPLLMSKHNNGGVVIATHFTSQRAKISHFRKSIGIVSEKILRKKQQIKDLITAKNGDIITISQIKHISEKFGGGLGGDDILLTRFTPSLRVKWQKQIGTSKNDYPKALLETSNQNIIIGALIDDDNQSFDLTFYKTDANGNQKWFHQYKWYGEQNLNSLTLTPKNNYLVNATYQNKNNNENILFLELDKHANIKWKMHYVRDKNEALYKVISLANEQYVGVGFTEREYNKDALIRFFDKNGTISRESIYGGSNSDYFNDIELLSDNSMYVSGCSSSITPNVQSSWLIKINPSMSIAKKTTPPFDRKKLINELKEKVVNPLKNWRIVMDKNIHFSFEHPRLNFIQGVTKLNDSHKVVLKSFFTKLLQVITSKKNMPHIKAIKIEGFASSEYNSSSKVLAFLGNAEVSSNRAMNVLRYLFELDLPHKEWLMQKISVDGYSFSKRKFKPSISPKKEDFKASRRIEISLKVE